MKSFLLVVGRVIDPVDYIFKNTIGDSMCIQASESFD